MYAGTGLVDILSILCITDSYIIFLYIISQSQSTIILYHIYHLPYTYITILIHIYTCAYQQLGYLREGAGRSANTVVGTLGFATRSTNSAFSRRRCRDRGIRLGHWLSGEGVYVDE